MTHARILALRKRFTDMYELTANKERRVLIKAILNP